MPLITPATPVAIIGAGPVGLAAAAHLAERGRPFVVLEARARAGHDMLAWSHVQLFSPCGGRGPLRASGPRRLRRPVTKAASAT